ncbi:hypothetical protein HELRODRAFT_167513 [Helobdella robusta]|uniref:B box-type domain-containing protein n=1 Tax=Helobdella robusta TaxID=6412 RepID=T1EZF9_HELRO|nr:hypothetical protein HELRODRAFT_167513 [Helobdella robusta]ESO10996.1 hypothetical protein HELRODRAFT_167513 [Helobdella robusta]
MDSVKCQERFMSFKPGPKDELNFINGSGSNKNKKLLSETLTNPSLICTKCRESENVRYKLLPCLHLCCVPCLEDLLEKNRIAMPRKSEVEEVRCSIFSCPQCSYVVRVVNGDVTFLRDIISKTSVNGVSQKLELCCSLNNNVNNDNGCYVLNKDDEDACANSNNSNNILKSNNLDVCCDNFSIKIAQYYCATCQMFLCNDCHVTETSQHLHSQHNLQPFNDFLNFKKSNVDKLLREIRDHKLKSMQESIRLNMIKENLAKNRDKMKSYITSKSDELCNQIMQHRDRLLQQLSLQFDFCLDEYNSKEQTLSKSIQALDDCIHFSDEFLQVKHTVNFLNIEDELISHMNRTLAQQQNNNNAKIKIQQFKLEQPDHNKRDQLIEKLLGSLIIGNVGSGISQSVAKYNAGISWPCCLATNNKDVIIAGKTESSGGFGKLLFFNKDTKLLKSISFHDNILPVDMISVDDRHFLLTTNSGEVSKFSFQGELVNKWVNIFEGPSGHMTLPDWHNITNKVNNSNEVLITNANNEITLFNTDRGEIKNRIKLKSKYQVIRSLAKHPTDDVIFIVFDNNIIQSFDSLGNLLNSNLVNSQTDIKCPTSIICDTFGNLLVSDFINDRISLFSSDGRFLGVIIDKQTDGISCPNKMMLDSHYKLYVAQCGGDVEVFNYISIVKKA